jgi:multiple antibiotic resistance protein
MPPELTETSWWLRVLTETVFFLALVNPISKVFILSVMSKEMQPRELLRVSRTSSLVALFILIVCAAGGTYVLTGFFHVQVQALQIAGGIVVFYVGFQALSRGRFFEVPSHERASDISVVPLASPMIAGPATITASISETAKLGFQVVGPAVVLALLVNFLVMLISVRIGAFLDRHHLMSALIRITGLLVAAIAVQMALDGATTWWKSVH